MRVDDLHWFRHHANLAITQAATVAAVLAAVRLSGAWPCDVSCQGGAAYSQIAGVSVTALGGGLAALIALLSWWQRRRPRASNVLSLALGLLGGGCLWFLFLSWQLHLRCAFCLIFHAVALCAVLAGWRWASPWRWLPLGFLIIHFAFTWRIEPERAQPPTVNVPVHSVDSEAAMLTARIEANRRLGAADAPVVIEEVLDLRCTHCAATHAQLLRALAEDLNAGRVAVVVRQALLMREPITTDLARWAATASGSSATDYQLLIETVLGTRLNNVAAYRQRFGALLPDSADQAVKTAVETVLESDRRWFAANGFTGAVPFIVLRRGAQIVTRFERDVTAAAIVDAVHALSP